MPTFQLRLLRSISHCNLSTLQLVTGSDLNHMQESLVFYYIASIIKHVEKLNEDRILCLIEDTGLMLLVARFLQQFHSVLSREVLNAAVDFLNLLTDTERYKTHKDKFLPTNSDKKLLVKLYDVFIKDLVSATPERRRQVFSLMDNINRFKILKE